MIKFFRKINRIKPHVMSVVILNHFQTDIYCFNNICIGNSGDGQKHIYSIRITYNEELVYETRYFENVIRYNYGKEWYESIADLYNEIKSKDFRDYKTRFKDM